MKKIIGFEISRYLSCAFVARFLAYRQPLNQNSDYKLRRLRLYSNPACVFHAALQINYNILLRSHPSAARRKFLHAARQSVCKTTAEHF